MDFFGVLLFGRSQERDFYKRGQIDSQGIITSRGLERAKELLREIYKSYIKSRN